MKISNLIMILACDRERSSKKIKKVQAHSLGHQMNQDHSETIQVGDAFTCALNRKKAEREINYKLLIALPDT